MTHGLRTLAGCLTLMLSGLPAALAAQDPQVALWEAARQGDTLVMGKALAAGAQVDSLDTGLSRNGRRALNYAALGNHVEAIAWLLGHGAGLNLSDRTGFTALHHAAEAGALAAAGVLLNAGADPEIPNRDGLVASEHGYLDVARLIEEAAARTRPRP